jgi:NAD(P)-dependent dehydrogenase (short-subunit alcohol dehydrogenase family)
MITTLLEDDVDENGDLLPPNLKTINVNLLGCLYTVKLGVHYLKKSPSDSSIVITASGSSYTRFPTTDYSTSTILAHHTNTNTGFTATAKHGVLGLMRSLYSHLHPKLPIRINAIAPSWTKTGLVPPDILAALGEGNYQSPDVVGRSVTLLMADTKRHGELVYSECGQFMELENGPAGVHARIAKMLGVECEAELAELRIFGKMEEMGAAVF